MKHLNDLLVCSVHLTTVQISEFNIEVELRHTVGRVNGS